MKEVLKQAVLAVLNNSKMEKTGLVGTQAGYRVINFYQEKLRGYSLVEQLPGKKSIQARYAKEGYSVWVLWRKEAVPDTKCQKCQGNKVNLISNVCRTCVYCLGTGIRHKAVKTINGNNYQVIVFPDGNIRCVSSEELEAKASRLLGEPLPKQQIFEFETI